jgi:hypothetical protein
MNLFILIEPNEALDSPDLEDFLNLLGEQVELKDFPHYAGGLDIKSRSFNLLFVNELVIGNGTGTHSIYTKYHGFEIMWSYLLFKLY